MNTLKGHLMKDNILTVRMTRRVAERVRKVAVKNGLSIGEWLRLAAIERLGREERETGGTANGS